MIGKQGKRILVDLTKLKSRFEKVSDQDFNTWIRYHAEVLVSNLEKQSNPNGGGQQ